MGTIIAHFFPLSHFPADVCGSDINTRFLQKSLLQCGGDAESPQESSRRFRQFCGTASNVDPSHSQVGGMIWTLKHGCGSQEIRILFRALPLAPPVALGNVLAICTP